MGNTYFFTHDDEGVQFYKDVWCLLEDAGMIKDCYVYVHDGHTYFGDTQDDVEENICECKELKATEWLKEQNEKVAELEASLQSTENYWKSNYELEADKVKKLQTELEGFKSIGNEYLCGPEASWQDLSNWCEDKTDEIVELKDEVEDLEEQIADLKEKYEVNIDAQ